MLDSGLQNILFRFLKPSSAPSAHQFVGSAAGPWANLQRTNSKTFHSAAPTPMGTSWLWERTVFDLLVTGCLGQGLIVCALNLISMHAARSPEWTGTQDLLPMRRQLSRQSFTSHSSHRSHPRSAQQPSPYVARSERDTNRPHHTSRTATVGTMGWQMCVVDFSVADSPWRHCPTASTFAS